MSLFQFSSDYSSLHAELTKKKNQFSDTCKQVKKFEPSLNEPVKTLDVKQLIKGI